MKILIADEEKVSQLAIKRILEKEGYEVEACSNGRKAIEMLGRERGYKMVIINRTIPEVDGIDLCREIRRMNLARYIYIILILADQRQDIALAKEAGADDFITKPFDNEVFDFKISAGMRVLNLEDKFFKSQKELIKLVKEDSLTNLLNRRSFIDESIRQLERASREGTEASCILADIDDFAGINDIYGNHTGDRILAETAERLRYACRPYDTIGRYSGAKFIIYLPSCKTASAVKIAKRLKSAISKKTYDADGNRIDVTACIGIANIVPDVGLKSAQVDELVKRAEAALEKAREQGKNKIVASS